MTWYGWLAFVAPGLVSAIFCGGSSLDSVGPQKWVGAQVHHNEEYGLQARFPTGTIVCTALSGSHPVGFHARLGRPTDCNEPRPPLVSSMSVTATYNAPADTAPDAFLGCRNGSVPPGSGVDLHGLGFRDAVSASCAVARPDGSLEILVAAQGGRYARRDASPESRAPLINYEAVLRTRPGRVRSDVETFRTFLAAIVIRPIVL